jgi:hypothetical protein
MSAKAVFAALIFVCLADSTYSLAQNREKGLNVKIHYEDPIRNEHYPELVYWFVTPETLASTRYTQDIQHIAHDTEFDFPFLTARNGVDFFTQPAAHDAVAGIVRAGHRNGLRIGATFALQSIDSTRKFPFDDEQTVVADAEGTLDANGRGVIESSVRLRSLAPLKTELLRVFVFRKTAEGEYDPATLANVTAQAKSNAPQPGDLSVTLDLGAKNAGYTAFVLATTWFNSLDLFGDAYSRWVHEAINQYRDVPFDGTALDEFGYMRLPTTPSTVWRSHLAGRAFGARFQQAEGMPLTQALFNARYAPAGHPEVRIRAIDRYWDFLRKGPLGVEQEFYNYSRQVFGAKNFAGIHNTFHNHLTNDEAWATGINWWTIPRQYGMSDEDLSLPLRMGLLVAHPGNIMYDQFYGWNVHRFAEKALNDARFDARIHYHGYNDTGRWGVDLSTEPFLSKINPVEQKIRLLNRFDPAAPELPLLVVFGMPALLNWYPDQAARNNYDVNGSLQIEEKVKEIWAAGYRCAVVPSDLIDNGSLRLDAKNRPTVNGHTFRAIIYLYPQYARRGTLAFLDEYTRRGGALMLEGGATRDFDGSPVDEIFASIAARARVKSFSVDRIPELGVEKSALRDEGGELEDGSVILTDLDSLESGKPKSFSVEVSGHQFSGAYIGVFALKASASGSVLKLACGGCQSLSRDGREILRLDSAADLLLTQTPAHQYEAVLLGQPGGNSLTLLP